MTRAGSAACPATVHGPRRAVAIRLAIVFWLIALGCSSGSPTGAVTLPLGGATWRVDEIDGAPVQGSDGPTISFEESGRVSGSTGCNRYFASLTVAGTELRVGNVAMTFRACPPPVMEQESRFLTALGAVRSYRLTGDTVELLDETGRVRLRLSRG